MSRGPLGQLATGMTVALSVMCTLAFVGFYTAGAVQALNESNPAVVDGAGAVASQVRVDAFWSLIAVTILALVLATRTAPTASLGFARVDLHPRRQTRLFLLILGVLACAVGWLPQLLVNAAQLPDPNRDMFVDTPALVALVGSFSAGIAEEILVLAVPLALLEGSGLTRWRIGRIPAGWLLIGCVLVAARMAFHLYRGWSTIQFLPWAIGAVLAFYWTRALIAMIAGHITWDLMAHFLPDTGLYATSAAAWYLTLGVLAVLGVAAGCDLFRRHELISSYLTLDQGRVSRRPDLTT